MSAKRSSYANRRKTSTRVSKYTKKASPTYTATKKVIESVIKATAEKKYVDIDFGAITDITNDTSVNTFCYILNPVQRGAAFYNRVGSEIICKHVRMKFSFRWISAASATPQVIGSNLRIVTLWVPGSLAALPNFDAVFGIVDQAGTASCDYNSPIQSSLHSKVQTLSDEIITMNPNVLQTTNTNAVFYDYHYDRYVKLNNRKTQFASSSNPMTVADFASGIVLLYFKTDAYADGTNEWNVFKGNSRFCYCDV